MGGAPRYSSSPTCAPHVALLPFSSTSTIERWLMKRVGAAPCQWSSPGSKNTRSPGRITSIGAAHPWLVYEDEEVRGFAYASKHRDRAAYRWSVDVSVHVASGARRRGVGRTLYEVLFRILERQHRQLVPRPGGDTLEIHGTRIRLWGIVGLVVVPLEFAHHRRPPSTLPLVGPA